MTTIQERDNFFELYREGFNCEQIAIKSYYYPQTVRTAIKKHPFFKNRKRLFLKSLADKFPDKMDFYDCEKNELRAEDIPPYSKIKIWLKCPEDGHSWLIQAREISLCWDKERRGCAVCSGFLVNDQNSLISKYPEQVNKFWDYLKNNQLGIYPSEVTKGSQKKAWFKCPIDHHQWESPIGRVTYSWDNQNSGCKICASKKKKGFL
jgi:hypothetical protein